MKAIELTYRSLLADVARLTGLSEIRGIMNDLHWCINDAPKLEKHVLECIEKGITPDLDVFPVQLRVLAMRSVVDPLSLKYLRQLLLFSYKALVTHDRKTTKASFIQFASTNDQVRQFGNSLGERSPRLLNQVRKHVQSVLYCLHEKDIIPFHGPGASATPKGVPWRKWYTQIEQCYPYDDYFSLYMSAEAAITREQPTDEHIQANLIAVPKDSRGPRLICVHPAESIWIQQGLRVQLERAISRRRSSWGPWPCGHVHFDDQSINGRMALLSSKSRKYATLDMKEASDRVSESLVQILFGRKYKWFGCCRAQKYRIKDPHMGAPELADPRVGPAIDDIHSYAPMGNATTFPVQSLVFWAICVASMQSRGFRQPNSVFVFGDDIIVPTAQAPYIIEDLESFGLLVNRTKSFWQGGFRESCGVDAFNGIDVTPVRWKTRLDAEGISGLQSLSDIALRLRKAGYEEAAITAYGLLRQRAKQFGIGQVFITNDPNHGGIAEYVAGMDSMVFRDAFWHRDSQWFATPVTRVREVEVIRQHNKIKNVAHGQVTPRLHGWIHVLESLTSLERLGRSNVPDRRVSRRVMLQRGWTPVL